MSWNITSEHKLLLCTIPTEATQDHNWEAVAQMMGEGYTAAEARQKFWKLKNEAKKAQTISTPGPKSATKVTAKTGSATLRRRRDLTAQSTATTPSKASKKQPAGADMMDLAADDDNEDIKPILEKSEEDGVYGRHNSLLFSELIEIDSDSDSEMEGAGHNAEEI